MQPLEFEGTAERGPEVSPGLLLHVFRHCWFSPTAAEPAVWFSLAPSDEQNTRGRKIAKHLISMLTASKCDPLGNCLNTRLL